MSSNASLPVFSTPQAEAEAMAAYRALLARWPVPYTELNVPTSFGHTHVVACGPQEAPPLVLLHAFFASALAWLPVAGALSDAFRVYAVDLLGEPGPSRPKRVIKTMDEQMQYLQELTDALGAPQADLVGNSFGAFFALTYALRQPERVRRLVLVGPAATIYGMPAFYVRSFLPKVLYMFLPWLPGGKRLVRGSIDWLLNGAPADPLWVEMFWQYMLNGSVARYLFPAVYPPQTLRKLTAPTLLLLGDKEVIYPYRAAMRAAQKGIPNVECAVIPNANHFTALSQPELTGTKMREFLCG